jgi:hypothetical protein
MLAGYRCFFGAHSSVEVSYGYSRSTQTYNLGSGPLGLDSNSDEFFAAYVFHSLHKRWSPFLLGGVLCSSIPEIQPGQTLKFAPGICMEAAWISMFTGSCSSGQSIAAFFYNSLTFNLTGLNGLDRFMHRAD